MREIKFRAWDKQNKLWYGRLGKPFTLQDAMGADWSTPVNQLEFMQYTGLKDKSGVEIYEGDILANAYHYPVNHNVKYGDIFGAVQWLNCAFWVGSKEDRPLMGDGKEYEVVGNIYENLELLK